MFLSGSPRPARPSWRGYSYVPLRQPPPRPRCALLPRPPGGGGGSHGDIRDKPCPGAAAASVSREGTGRPGRADQNPVLPRILPVQWTVGISPWGEGTGEGVSPSPGKISPKSSSPAPPPRPRCALLPAPSRGRGQSWRYPGRAVPGSGSRAGFPGGESQNPVLPRVLPVQWTVVAIAMGGGDRGGGLPPPRRRVPVRSSSKPSPPEGGQYVGYPGKTVPRMQTPRKWKKDDDLLR